jgi:transcriptional regulator with XRE-family HTH domain
MGRTRIDRLREAMREAGLDQTALAERIGCSQGAISQILVGRTRQSRLLPDIARALDVSVEWLLDRTDDRRAVAPASSQAELEARYNVLFVPELGAGDIGGRASDMPLAEGKRSLVPLPRDWLGATGRDGAGRLFVTRGRGDSMAPTIGDGDVVIVDRAQAAVEEQDGIWALAHGAVPMMVKRLRRLAGGGYAILSDNPSVAPWPPAAADEIDIIGRVVWVGRAR